MPLRSGRAGWREEECGPRKHAGVAVFQGGDSPRGPRLLGPRNAKAEGRQGSMRQRAVAGAPEPRSRAAQCRARAGSRLRRLSLGGEGTSQRAEADGAFSKLRFKEWRGMKSLRNG